MRLRLKLLLAIFVFLLLAPPALAQTPSPKIDWQELKTDHFIIVYAERVEGLSILACACGKKEAQTYANFIDDIYEDLVAVFGVELDTPINLRLFPTEDSYIEVNPIAGQITGVVAHALNNRSEIAIALSRTEQLTDEEIINNMRHELTHFFASLLSDGNLRTGFQEGVAQYLEKPTANAEYDSTILQQALEQSRLLSWAELDEAQRVWMDPQVAYPEALSIAAFLIDRYGFPKIIDFIKATATEPGYRSALEKTYGQSADALEKEWLAYLPEYFAGRWQINSVYAYDLGRVTELVDRGAFSDAETELADIVGLLETTDQTDTLATAEQLLARAQQGRAAGALADEARRALLASDYPAAVTAANEAIVAFETLGYLDRIPELQVYVHRAELGQEALAQLEHGAQLLNTLQFFEAEQKIRDATVLLQSLNNQSGAQRGVELLLDLATRQRLLAYAALGIGLLLAAANAVRRLALKFSAGPLEVEYS